MQLTGIHHLTAVSADAPGNLRFYTQVMGMRLIKKTVNQDDTSAYHLFYADGLASPGSDLTFFDWPVGHERRGTHSVSRTGLRVATRATLDWWKTRFAEEKVKAGDIKDIGGRATLDFEDGEGQRFRLRPELFRKFPFRFFGHGGSVPNLPRRQSALPEMTNPAQ